MDKESKSTGTKKKKTKAPVAHTLTHEPLVLVRKMKVMELNKWTPVLKSEQTPMLYFEGYVSRINGQKRRYTAYKTQPLDVRLGSYLFRQVNGETCSLVGELYDPSNNIPLPVKSKFKNGIPKRWQTIAEFWDNMQKHSFCRKRLRSFSSRCEWVESLKSSGMLRVSSRGRIIIPSPKYVKGKNVERRDVEAAHLICSQLNMIRTNLDVTPIHKTDDIRGTPRRPVENNDNTVNVNKSRHCTTCEKPTENTQSKSNLSEDSSMKAVKNSGNHMDRQRSSINQRKFLTCKRKLIVAEVQRKLCRSSRTSKNTYEKITNKYHYRCLPHRRKYLLRSTAATQILQKKNQCKKKPRVTPVNMRANSTIVLPQAKQYLQTKRKLNVLNNKNNILRCQGKKNAFSGRKSQEGKGSKETDSRIEYSILNSVLETESCYKECRSESAVNTRRNQHCKVVLQLPHKEPCQIVSDIQSDNVLKNCVNRLRKSKQQVSCQDSSGMKRPKKKSENSPPPKANKKGVNILQHTFKDSGPVLSDRKSTGYVEPLLSKRHEEINRESMPAGDQDLLEKKVTPRNICDNMSGRNRFTGKCVTSPLNNTKSSQSNLRSNERQTENKRCVVRHQLNEKEVRKMSIRSRKRSLSTSKSTTAVKAAMKGKAEALEDTKDAATIQGKMLNNASKRKTSKENSKQPRISDQQSAEKTEPCITSKVTLETPLRKTEKTERNLPVGPVLSERKSTGCVEPLLSKSHEEINKDCVVAGEQYVLEEKVTSRNISEDKSRGERFSEKCVTLPLNNRKSSQPKLIPNERQTKSRRGAARNQLNKKGLHEVPDRSRKKSLSTSKSSTAVKSAMRIKAEALEDTKEAATTQEKMLHNASKSKISEEDDKQPRISDLQSAEKTESCISSKAPLESPPRKTKKIEPNLSLEDIEDILTTGAPRTLKQRKKLRKTIDSYAKSQTACTDLFSDPDYNHLIGDNDPCSSQEWDKDYAEAIEKLVNGKLSDQMSLGSTSPAQYLQDFVCDDNQSVRSASPFERTPCDEEFKLRYEHRVLKERNEHSRRKSFNMDVLSSFAQRETDASNEADAAYDALIQGKPVPQKLFDLKCKKNNNSSDDSSSECSDEF